MRKIVISVVCLSLLAVNAYSFDGSYRFIRVPGGPTYFTETFVAVAGQASLSIVNGNIYGKNDISSAKVTLNGVQIASQENFNRNADNIDLDVSLIEGENNLTVQLTSKPGSELNISISQNFGAESVIGNSGGIVVVDFIGSPILGAAVILPENAITKVETINIEPVPLPMEMPEKIRSAGVSVKFGPEGQIFDLPVLLNIPYHDNNNDGVIDGTSTSEYMVGVYYYNDDILAWENMPVIRIDHEANIATISVKHFSTYTPYIVADNSIDTTTKRVNDSDMTVDGNPKDWANILNETAAMIPDDIPNDNSLNHSCNSQTDIKNVYTAIGEEFAYVMIETHTQSINPASTFEIYFNYSEGSVFQWLNLAEIGMNFHGPNFTQAPGLTSAWNPDTGLLGYVGESNGHITARGTVIEARIPLSFFGGAPDYFNVERAGSWVETGYSCDQLRPYTSLGLMLQNIERQYNSEVYNRLTLTPYDQMGHPVIDDIFETVELFDPDGVAISLDSPTFSVWEMHYGGFYDWLQDWRFSDPVLEAYTEYRFDGPLIPGSYRITAYENSGTFYEETKNVKSELAIPTMDSNDVSCSFDGGFGVGSLTCTWPPLTEGNYPELFTENTGLRVLIHIIKDGQRLNREGFYTVPLEFGYITINADNITKLFGDADSFDIQFQLRTLDNNRRTYSQKVTFTQN